MRPRRVWFCVLSGIGAALLIGLRAESQEAQTSTPETEKKEEKVVYTFQDDAEIQAFAKLWQQREGILLRLAVLQAYWNEEQAILEQLNNQLAVTYKLDSTRNYFLNTDRKVLIQEEGSSPSPLPQGPLAPPSTDTSPPPSRP